MLASEKRRLTPDEQTYLIDACLAQSFTSQATLPTSMYRRFVQEFHTMLRAQLEHVEIYPEALLEFQQQLIRKFRPVPPAKAVGIICGQSIGEMQTQTTLNTFHKTGLTEKLVVAGVPRFLEIIDTNRSETQGTPSAYLFFRTPAPQTIAETRQRVGSSLVYFTLEKLVVRWSARAQAVEPWVPPALHTGLHVHLELDLEILFRYKIALTCIVERLAAHFPSFQLLASPLHQGIVMIWPGSTIDCEVDLEDKLYPQLAGVAICGIERIQNIFFLKHHETSEWYIETDGSNLEQLLNLPYVDSYRTYSNDIWEVYALFGIEAVRTYIVEELTQLMPTIHATHITLLADRMTVSGRLRSISRYTRKHENSSVLSKATFEETLSGFLRSAILNEVDAVNGSSASIICGRIPKVGTGLNDLIL